MNQEANLLQLLDTFCQPPILEKSAQDRQDRKGIFDLKRYFSIGSAIH